MRIRGSKYTKDILVLRKVMQIYDDQCSCWVCRTIRLLRCKVAQKVQHEE